MISYGKESSGCDFQPENRITPEITKHPTSNGVPFVKKFLYRIPQTAVFWSITATALRFGGIVLVLPMMLSHLDSNQMGLWYLFLSFGTLANLVDAGLAFSSTRATSYLWSGALEIVEEGMPRRHHEDHTRIDHQLFADFFKTLSKYYFFVALFVLLLAGLGGGWWIWHKTEGLPSQTSARWAWALFIVGIAHGSYASVWSILLQGINGVRQAQRSFVAALVINYVLTLIGLKLDWGLWAPVAGNFAQGLVARILQRKQFHDLAGFLVADLNKGSARWSIIARLWPQAWRSGTLSIGIYLTISAGTLVISWVGGLEKTANYGLSLQLSLAIIQISSMPFIVKIPLLTQLRATQDLGRIRNIVIGRLAIYWFLAVSGSIALIFLGNWLLVHLARSSTSLLPVSTLIPLLLFLLLEGNQGIFRELVLTTNHNPFVIQILVTGVAVFLAAAILGPLFGVAGIVWAQLLLPLLWNNWQIVRKGLSSLRLSPS